MTAINIEPLPGYLQLEPVGQCNLRCQMCPVQFRQDGPPYGPPAFMDFGLFTRIIEDVPTVQKLHLQGLGEPMMHPRFFDMVAHATERGIEVTTNSNLTLLNPRKAERCVTSGLRELHVSIDAADADTYARIRVGGRLERVLANLALVRAARARLGARSPRLHLVMVVMRQNLEQLPALVAHAHEWGIEEMFVQHLAHDFGEPALPAHYFSMRRFVDEQTLLQADPQWVAACFEAARTTAVALGLPLRLPRVQPQAHPPSLTGRARCDWPWRGMYISYQGYAMPCCMVATPDRATLGDVRGRRRGNSLE